MKLLKFLWVVALAFASSTNTMNTENCLYKYKRGYKKENNGLYSIEYAYYNPDEQFLGNIRAIGFINNFGKLEYSCKISYGDNHNLPIKNIPFDGNAVYGKKLPHPKVLLSSSDEAQWAKARYLDAIIDFAKSASAEEQEVSHYLTAQIEDNQQYRRCRADLDNIERWLDELMNKNIRSREERSHDDFIHDKMTDSRKIAKKPSEADQKLLAQFMETYRY